MAAPRGIPGMNPYTGKAGIGDAAYQSRQAIARVEDRLAAVEKELLRLKYIIANNEITKLRRELEAANE